MIKDFYIKQGDTLPSIAATLIEEDGDPVNLTDSEVFFRMARIGGTEIAGGVAVISGSTEGKVRYDWQATDTAIAGEYLAEWVVINAADKRTTYPNSRYLLIDVKKAVNGGI